MTGRRTKTNLVDWFEPNLKNYKMRIQELIDWGEFRQAEKQFYSMRWNLVEPDAAIYKMILSLFIKAEDTERAIKYQKEMHKKGFKSDLQTSLGILHLLASQGKNQLLEEYFEDMKNVLKIDPSRKTYSWLIESLAKQGNQLSRIEYYMTELRQLKLTPGVEDYQHLFQTMAETDNFERLSKFLNESKDVGESNPETLEKLKVVHTEILKSLFTLGEYERLTKYVSQLVSNRIPFQAAGLWDQIFTATEAVNPEMTDSIFLDARNSKYYSLESLGEGLLSVLMKDKQNTERFLVAWNNLKDSNAKITNPQLLNYYEKIAPTSVETDSFDSFLSSLSVLNAQ